MAVPEEKLMDETQEFTDAGMELAVKYFIHRGATRIHIEKRLGPYRWEISAWTWERL